MTSTCQNCGTAVSSAWARVYSAEGVVYCCESCSTQQFRGRPAMDIVRAIIDAADEGEYPEYDLTAGRGVKGGRNE